MAIKKVSIDKMLDKKLKNKEYVLKPGGNYHLPHIAEMELQLRGVKGSKLYVARRTYCKIRIPRNAPIEFDDNNYPYFIVSYGGKSFAFYDGYFLTNGSMASAMGRSHEKILKRVYEQIDEAPELLKFHKKYLKDLEKRLPEIKEGLLRAEFEGNLESAIERLDYQDRKLIELGAIKEGHLSRFSGSTTEINDRLVIRDQAEAFVRTYHKYIDSDLYREKIEQTAEENDWRFRKYLKKLEKRLKKKGFVKVDELAL